jgi:hypothetical protein
MRRGGQGPLGDYFAEVLLLDQVTDAAKARAELGWAPARPGLVDEFREGSYRRSQPAAQVGWTISSTVSG